MPLDGKILRRSFDKATGQKPLHILNAWAINAGVSLGQIKVGQKTNEITAVPDMLDMLDMLDIRHTTIVADALNTQKAIAKKIIASEADYALPVKAIIHSLRRILNANLIRHSWMKVVEKFFLKLLRNLMAELSLADTHCCRQQYWTKRKNDLLENRSI